MISEYIFKGSEVKIFIDGNELSIVDSAVVKVEHTPRPPDPQPPFIEKNVYLTTKGEEVILGLHQIGDMVPVDESLSKFEFIPIESWVNVYDKDMNFKYSAARFSGPIENEVKAYTDEGWVVKKQDTAQGEPI